MTHNLLDREVKLYVWPGQWDLPSYDPYSLSAIMHMQLAIPGKFRVIECADPDLSPSGQFPFLAHEQEVVASYPSIIRYIAGLAQSDKSTYPGADVDSFLPSSSRSQRNAWTAHAEANLGNLVASAIFASTENWEGLTVKALSTMFPVPQKYYVPSKLREAYQPRLEVAGLWSQLPPVEEKKKTPFEKELRKRPTLDTKKVQQMFIRERIVAKAKPILDVYERLLGNNRYIFENRRISSLDVAIAARVLLLTKPPYPDAAIKDLITTSYPNLLAHAQHVEDRVLGSNNRPLKTERHSYSLWSLFPSTLFSFKTLRSRREADKTDEERHIDHMRWGFAGLVVGVVCAYMAVLAPSQLALANRVREQRRLQHELHARGSDGREPEDDEYEEDDEDLGFVVYGAEEVA